MYEFQTNLSNFAEMYKVQLKEHDVIAVAFEELRVMVETWRANADLRAKIWKESDAIIEALKSTPEEPQVMFNKLAKDTPCFLT